MRKTNGHLIRNDDEWYTTRRDCDKVAMYAKTKLSLDTPILCPADILPDGNESEFPKALRAAGFMYVRVTRNLPVIYSPLGFDDAWRKGEVIITNPPFSLAMAFRSFLEQSGAKFICLTRDATFSCVPSIPAITSSTFKAKDGRRVAAYWCSNLPVKLRLEKLAGRALGNCADCENSRCPRNKVTGNWTPGRERPLYGMHIAAISGISGWWCYYYLKNGKRAFSRFFVPELEDGHVKGHKEITV